LRTIKVGKTSARAQPNDLSGSLASSAKPCTEAEEITIDKFEDLDAHLFYREVENLADNAELSQLHWSGHLKNLLQLLRRICSRRVHSVV
jgi:hypothetical protein